MKQKLLLLTATQTFDEPRKVTLAQAYIDETARVGLPFIAGGDEARLIHEYADSCDALIVTGGYDINPARYGQPKHRETVLATETDDELELALVSAFRSAGKRILGICRGMQAINVALYGNLYQHLPDNLDTDIHQKADGDAMHEVILEEGSLIERLCGTQKITVNSAHHQAVHLPGQGLQITGRSEGDAVCECLESMDGQILGVQWHPERLPSDMTCAIFDWVAGK